MKLKEPLLWFFILGGILFAVDHYVSDQPDQVIVDNNVRTRLANLWRAQTGNVVTTSELDSLVESWIKEEVLYREAKQLGLDRDDSIVRRRLVQKLSFLVEEVDDDVDDRAAMEKYYRENIENYSLPVRYSFSQIFFSDISTAPGLRLDLTRQVEWRKLGEVSMLGDSYVARSEKELVASFGQEFASHLGDLEIAQWVGPVKSSFGFHLVRLEKISQKEATPLAYIEKRVWADYQQKRMDSALETYYQGLREKYAVVYQ